MTQKMKRNVILLALLLFVVGQYFGVSSKGVLIDTKGTAKEGERFIPTNEWQIVKEGQMIPPGLHIRSNLQTGIVEAKLMERDANKDKEGLPVAIQTAEKVPVKITKRIKKAGDQKPAVTGTTTSKLSREQIMEALKTIADQDDVKDKKVAESAKKKKFRNYEDLKKDFEKMNVHVKTDGEIIKELASKLNRTNSTTEERIAALTDLEYYLHQIDNAIDFMKMDGLQLLLDEMNSSDRRLRSEATFAIGSAIQSNVKVQIRALELGLLKALKRQLVAEGDAACLNRALYSLSTLLRNFPYAQLRFVEVGGLEALRNLFVDEARTQPRLQVRMVTLLHDLVTEQSVAERELNASDAMQVEKLRQYKQVNAARRAVALGWCDLAPRLLHLPDHDGREKALVALHSLLAACPAPAPAPRHRLLDRLAALDAEYRGLAAQEAASGDADAFFASILRLVRRVREHVNQRPTAPAPDEL